VDCKKFTLRPDGDGIPDVGGMFRHPKLARLAGLYARIRYDSSSANVGFWSRVACRGGWAGSYGGLHGNGKIERLYTNPSLLDDAREDSSTRCSVAIYVDPDTEGAPTLVTVEVYASYRRLPRAGPFG
jgi:hypothetical protein